MRLLKSVLLTGMLWTSVVTSIAQNLPTGPSGFSHRAESGLMSPRDMRPRDFDAPASAGAAAGGFVRPSTNCSAENAVIDQQKKTIALMQMRIAELEGSKASVAKAGDKK